MDVSCIEDQISGEPYCHCGQPIHYKVKSTEEIVKELIETYGEYVTITVNGKSWKVQRHYIALHGITGKDVSTLGFEEIL